MTDAQKLLGNMPKLTIKTTNLPVREYILMAVQNGRLEILWGVLHDVKSLLGQGVVTEHDPMLQKALDAEITKRIAETAPLLNNIDNILSTPQFEYRKENMSKLIDLAHLSTQLMEAQGEQLALQLRICGLRKELQEANLHLNTQAAVRNAEQQRALDRINDRQKQIDSSPLNQ